MADPDYDNRGDVPSASSMRRVRLCPGSHIAETKAKAVGLKGDCQDALVGTQRHDLIEVDADPDSIDDSNTAYTVKRAAELLDEARIIAGINGLTNEIRKEVRYWLHDDQLKAITSARLDHFEISHDTRIALVADYKTLFGDHGAAKDNEQLMVQACVAAAIEPAEYVFVALIQPNLPKARQLSVARYSRGDIRLARQHIESWVRAAMHPDAPRIPGPQCLNCAAAGVCAESQAATLAIRATESVDAMTPQRLGQFLELVKPAEAIIKAAQNRAKAILEEDPNAFDGMWSLKPGSTRRNITDIGKAFTIASETGVTAEEFQAGCSITIGEMERLHAAKFDGTKKDAKEQIHQRLKEAGILEEKQNRPSLVKGTTT